MKRPLVYTTATWNGDHAAEGKRAVSYYHAVYKAGFSLLCPMLYLPLFLTTPS